MLGVKKKIGTVFGRESGIIVQQLVTVCHLPFHKIDKISVAITSIPLNGLILLFFAVVRKFL